MKKKSMDMNFEIPYKDGCYHWPNNVPLPDGTGNGERRFQIKTFGPWQIPVSVRGLAVSVSTDSNVDGYNFTWPTKAVIYGDRTLSDVRQSDYVLEGRVSIEGKKYRAFTSDILVRTSDGKLYSLDTLNVCI